MITIADTGGSNISSIRYALKRLGEDSELIADADKIYNSSKVIVPGVGAASDSMQRLQKLELEDVLLKLKQPTLGICIGMHLLFNHSQEGDVDLLGVFDAEVKKIVSTELTVPHMGWNQVNWCKDDCLLIKDIPSGENFYFVHSFAAPVGAWTVGETKYGENFSAVVQQDNYFAVQFHPEKSSKMGSQLLRNFVKL